MLVEYACCMGEEGEEGGAWLACQGDSSGPSICRLLFELSFPCFCPKRARELLQFMQFFPNTHTYINIYVYMYMYRSLFTNVCVCTYYMALRWEEYFFKLLSKLLFHFMICNSLSVCVRVCVFARGSACGIQSCRMPIFICICIWRISIFSCSPPPLSKKRKKKM